MANPGIFQAYHSRPSPVTDYMAEADARHAGSSCARLSS